MKIRLRLVGRRRGILATALSALLMSQIGETAAGAEPKQVWFAPESHYPPAKDVDFLDIFRRPEAWEHAAAHVQVFQISTQTFLAAPDTVIAEIVSFLKDRHMRLAVAAEYMCGDRPGTIESARGVVEKVQKAGGVVDYVAMDEPLYHVHYSGGEAGCHLSIDKTAARVAAINTVYTTAFPKVIVGDIEPFPIMSGEPDWKRDYVDWARALKAASGRPIQFLQLDFNWRERRLTKGSLDVSDPEAIVSLAREVAAFARSQRLTVGMIFNGKANADSDGEWVHEAEENINFIERSGIDPGQLIFASWHKHPQKALPETDPSTFSGLIMHYFARP